MAIYLLSDELPEVAEHARAAARRVGDLGGAVTADPASSSTARPAMRSSPSPTARTRGPSPATRCTAWTSLSRPTRRSWTRCGGGMM
jgi:hypothetical protein